MVAAEADLATSIVSRAGEALVRIADLERTVGPARFEPVSPRIFDVLSDEMDGRRPEFSDLSSKDAAPAVSGTLAAQLHAVAREVVELRHSINVASLTVDGEPVFKPTVKTERFSYRLVVDAVSNRDEFDSFADDLYEYVYESSGEWKRIKNRAPGFPKVADAIKQLRRFGAHDIEHGKESEIRTKAQQVGEHLLRLTGKRVPSTAREWQKAQLGLLHELAAFLRDLDDKLKSPDA